MDANAYNSGLNAMQNIKAIQATQKVAEPNMADAIHDYSENLTKHLTENAVLDPVAVHLLVKGGTSKTGKFLISKAKQLFAKKARSGLRRIGTEARRLASPEELESFQNDLRGGLSNAIEKGLGRMRGGTSGLPDADTLLGNLGPVGQSSRSFFDTFEPESTGIASNLFDKIQETHDSFASTARDAFASEVPDDLGLDFGASVDAADILPTGFGQGIQVGEEAPGLLSRIGQGITRGAQKLGSLFKGRQLGEQTGDLGGSALPDIEEAGANVFRAGARTIDNNVGGFMDDLMGDGSILGGSSSAIGGATDAVEGGASKALGLAENVEKGLKSATNFFADVDVVDQGLDAVPGLDLASLGGDAATIGLGALSLAGGWLINQLDPDKKIQELAQPVHSRVMGVAAQFGADE